MRKLKRPDGQLFEEFIAASIHVFENGDRSLTENDTDGGDYTGRFWFEFTDGKRTPMYTEKTAPKWLAALRGEI